MNKIDKKIIVIGGGPAGLSAVVSACENGVSPSDILIIERDRELGGILNQCIHAGFGLHYFGTELTGPEYAGRFIEKVKSLGIGYVADSMVLSLSDDRTLTFVSPEYGFTSAKADAVILAMGCRERTRGSINIPGSRPAGIYSAGTAQRYVNIEGEMPGRKVVILGSGDIGLIMARRLTLEGAQVLRVCELMPYSGGLARNITQCLEDFNIPLYLSHTVTSIEGRDRVSAVVISEVDEKMKPIPGTEERVECDTLLLSVGLIPENELTRGAQIQLDRVTSGAQVDQYCETSAEGIYACGNVLHVHDLVDFVSREAENAGKAAAKRVLSGASATASATAANKTSKTTVKPGGVVRYVVPQRLSASEGDNLRFFFRVGNEYRKVRVTVTADGKELYAKKKPSVAPGEMESVELTGDAAVTATAAAEVVVSVMEE